MVCKECSNPLKIISGGNKAVVGSTEITMIHVWGCLNPACSCKMEEQSRSESSVESFKG